MLLRSGLCRLRAVIRKFRVGHQPLDFLLIVRYEHVRAIGVTALANGYDYGIRQILKMIFAC